MKPLTHIECIEIIEKMIEGIRKDKPLIKDSEFEEEFRRSSNDQMLALNTAIKAIKYAAANHPTEEISFGAGAFTKGVDGRWVRVPAIESMISLFTNGKK